MFVSSIDFQHFCDYKMKFYASFGLLSSTKFRASFIYCAMPTTVAVVAQALVTIFRPAESFQFSEQA